MKNADVTEKTENKDIEFLNQNFSKYFLNLIFFIKLAFGHTGFLWFKKERFIINVFSFIQGT